MTTDPGSVPKNARPLIDDEEERAYDPSRSKTGESFKKYCKRCKAFKPTRAHHCSICDRCIIKMDHHCPWVNNCVGIGNHKLFLLFIFFVFVVSLYSVALLTMQYVLCSVYGSGCGDDMINMFVVFLLIESLCCAIFTSCMMGDQVPNIATRETQIDRLKRNRDTSPSRKTKTTTNNNSRADNAAESISDDSNAVSSALESGGYNHLIRRFVSAERAASDFNEVFGCSSGGGFHLSWLLPTPLRYPRDVFVRSKVLGYCLESEIIDGDEELSLLINEEDVKGTLAVSSEDMTDHIDSAGEEDSRSSGSVDSDSVDADVIIRNGKLKEPVNRSRPHRE